MLEEVGKRHGGNPGAAFSFRSCGTGMRGGAKGQMTITFVEGTAGQDQGQQPIDLLAFTEQHFAEAALALAQMVEAVRDHRFDDLKMAQTVVRDMKAAYQLAMEERNRVDKLRKQAAGIVHGYAIDMDAARDEVGRRLARLRDAGGD